MNSQLRAVSGGMVGFESFLNPHPVRALTSSESRFTRDVADLPAAFRRSGLVVRSCVRDNSTAKTRFECVRGERATPCLHLVLDRGPGSWTSVFPLFQVLPVVGTFAPDFPHKCHDDTLSSVSDCGLRLLKCALVIAVNFFGGPWKGSGFFQQLQGVALRFQEAATVESSYVQFWYSKLFTETGLPVSQYGSAESMQAVLDRLHRCKSFRTRGERVKMSRWWSLVDRLEEMLCDWFSIACMLSLLALEKGLFKNVYDLMASTSGQLVGGALDPAVEDDGHRELEHGLKSVLCTLASSLNRQLASMIVVMTSEVRADCGIFLSRQKDIEQGAAILTDWALGRWVKTCIATVVLTRSPAKLEEIGFRMYGSSGIQHVLMMRTKRAS
eukprot:6490362-Amphidinium_carterae.3